MKNIKKLFLSTHKITRTITIGILLCATSALSQSNWYWCEPVDKTKEKSALFFENVKTDKFQNAKPLLDELLQSCPRMHVSLYKKGIKVYKGLLENTTNQELKLQYQNKVIELYDKQIEYFGSEAKVLNKKAYDAYNYFINNQSKLAELLKLFDRTFLLNKNSVYIRNLAPYMNVISSYQKLNNNLTDDHILNRYNFITDIINIKLKDSNVTVSKRKRLIEIQDAIDKMLFSVIDLNCEKINKLYVKKLYETKSLNLAKQIFKLALKNKCTSTALAIEAANIIVKTEPNKELYKYLGNQAEYNKEYNKAISHYNKEANLTEDKKSKSEIFLKIARITALNGDFKNARVIANKAIVIHPQNKKAFIFIGTLYMNSYNECKNERSIVQSKAIFIAAYNMFKKADYSEGMSITRQRFPTTEEIFFESRKVGELISIDCWINIKVTLVHR